MRKTIPSHWELTETQVKEIFDVEKQHADQLRQEKDPHKRRLLYGPVYKSYFEKLPFHPQFTIKHDEQKKKDRTDYQLALLKPYINNQTTLLEIGAGDCSLSIAAAPYCKKVIALEVSEEITSALQLPHNVSCVIFDGFNMPFEPDSIDVAYSNQLMEHLHPDDAVAQLQSLCKCLKKGGAYICITPNRILGPNDISRFFTDKLVGFHLAEYTAIELKNLFMHNGFERVEFYSIIKGKKINWPHFIISITEFFFSCLPHKLRDQLSRVRPFSMLINATVAAIK